MKVESAPVTNHGAYATSTGTLLRDNRGNKRLTAANHGFLYSDEVYHPSHAGRRIGEIGERFEALDIALIKLDPYISFSNRNYFEAFPPKRLLRSEEAENGIWSCANGISTGAVFL